MSATTATTATATTKGTGRRSRFQDATRERIKLRMAIDGPSGSGKTLSALRFAMELAAEGSGRVAVIDSESGSARKYINEAWDGRAIRFAVDELQSFSPSEYEQAIVEAGQEGFDVIVIDSLSHAWDGALELVDKKGGSGNKFTAWKDVTPLHRRMIDAILTSPAHVIATMRSKTEYILEPDSNGKMVPRKVGLSPVQRAGMEYEFDVGLSMDWSHIGTVTKTRCPTIDGKSAVKPGAGFMRPIIDWLNIGSSAAATATARPTLSRIRDDQMQAIVDAAAESGMTSDQVRAVLPGKFAVTDLGHLLEGQADELLKWVQGQGRLKRPTQKAVATKGGAVETAPAAAPVVAPQEPAPAVPAEPTTEPAPDPDPPAAPAAAIELPASGRITEDRMDAIGDLRNRLNPFLLKDKPDWYGQALAKRGVKSVRQLSQDQADEMIGSMQSALLKLAPATESTPTEPGTVPPN